MLFAAQSKGCEGMLPAVPDESMESGDAEEPAKKAVKTKEMSAARADAIARGDDMSDDADDEEAEGWIHHGSNKAVETLRRKIQCGHDQELAKRYAQKRQVAKKVKAKAKASPTGQ